MPMNAPRVASRWRPPTDGRWFVKDVMKVAGQNTEPVVH